MGQGLSHSYAVDTKEILARNLRSLMEANERLSTYRKITAAGGGSNGTLDRINRQDGNSGLNKIDPLAKVFGLKPWQLLVPNFDALNPPTLADASPLAADLAKMFDAIPDESQRRRAYAMCVQLIQFAEPAAGPASAPLEPGPMPTRKPARAR